MKKIGLNVMSFFHTEVLTRAELKNIRGGNMPLPNIQCNFYSNGTGSCAAADDMPSNCGDLDDCQDTADRICDKYDCCDDSACKYA